MNLRSATVADVPRVNRPSGWDPAGPVRFELAFVVDSSRNWLNLWKPTIDALDPLLGRTRQDRAWHPLDGRITELGMHLAVDPALRNDVVVGIVAAPV